MTPAIVIEGKLRQLGRRIGKGGEGEIYTLADDRSLAVKVYTMPDLGDRARKIRALVEGQLAQKAPLVAFPLAEAKTRAGNFLGFSMQLVDGYKPLHELYAPGPRKLHFPHADYRFLVRAASNIARAVASVHRSGCVIGDINHSGILVSPKAVVALIDADSFQITRIHAA
jgi:DNA-binding helix-hairpin-helix protein with protein kinase domain